MKVILYTLGLWIAFVSACTACSLNWQLSMDDAYTEARKTKKLILVFFTGSDWSPRTIALDKDVMEKPDFSDHADRQFVLYHCDFPQRQQLKESLQTINRSLAEKFGVRHFPTIVALTPDGAEYDRLEFRDQDVKTVMFSLSKWHKSNAESQVVRATEEAKPITASRQ